MRGEGVGSLFRPKILPIENALVEKDSRPRTRSLAKTSHRRQNARRIEWQRAHIADDFQVRSLAGLVQVRGGTLDFGDVERVVNPHQLGVDRLGQPDDRK